MSRWIAVVGFSLAVTLSLMLVAPASFEAEAAKKPKNKQCMATQLDGKKVSFKCKSDEKCCFDSITNKGNCLPANGICL